MGRRKKGDTADAISKQIARIVLAGGGSSSSTKDPSGGNSSGYGSCSGYTPTSVIRVASAGTHQKFLDKQFHKVTDTLKATASKLFSMPTSDVIIAGCPSASSVVNAFEAASVHSELGRLLRGFASATVELFTKGPNAVAEFPEKWVHAMENAPEKYIYELQGFSALFSFLYYQVVQGQKKYLDALKKAMLPDTVVSIDALIDTLSALRERLAAPQLGPEGEDITEGAEEITIHVANTAASGPDAPVGASCASGTSPSRAERSPNVPPRMAPPGPPPPPHQSVGQTASQAPAPRRHPVPPSTRRCGQSTEHRSSSPQKRNVAAVPASLMEFGSHDTLPNQAVVGTEQPAVEWALSTSSQQHVRNQQRLTARALPAMEDAVGRGMLPTAALSTGALLAQGIPLPPMQHSPRTDHTEERGGAQHAAVAEVHPKLFNPQMPVPRVTAGGRNGVVGGTLQSLSVGGGTNQYVNGASPPQKVRGPQHPQLQHPLAPLRDIPRSARGERDDGLAHAPLLPLPTVAAMRAAHSDGHRIASSGQPVLASPPRHEDSMAPSTSRGWKEFWEEEDKRKLQQQISGCRTVTDYRPRDLARYAAEMEAMRREVLGSDEEASRTFEDAPAQDSEA